MKRTLNILLISAFIISMACTKADEEAQKNVGTLTYPIASFTFSGNEGPAPCEVSFQNTSQYCDTYEWSFTSYGPTSNEFEPTHVYQNNTGDDKTFLVTLKVTDSGSGLSNTRSKSIVIQSSK